MKIIAICGSPRKGNTEAMVREVLRGAKETNAETELILLKDIDVSKCIGCEACKTVGRCTVNKDDVDKIYDKMFESDVFVLGSPCYFNNVSGLMKDFIDRCDPYWEDKRWASKKAVLVSVANYKAFHAIRAMEQFCKICRITVVDTLSAQADVAGEITKNKKIMKKCFELGKKLVRN